RSCGATKARSKGEIQVGRTGDGHGLGGGVSTQGDAVPSLGTAGFNIEVFDASGHQRTSLDVGSGRCRSSSAVVSRKLDAVAVVGAGHVLELQGVGAGAVVTHQVYGQTQGLADVLVGSR